MPDSPTDLPFDPTALRAALADPDGVPVHRWASVTSTTAPPEHCAAWLQACVLADAARARHRARVIGGEAVEGPVRAPEGPGGVRGYEALAHVLGVPVRTLQRVVAKLPEAQRPPTLGEGSKRRHVHFATEHEARTWWRQVRPGTTTRKQRVPDFRRPR